MQSLDDILGIGSRLLDNNKFDEAIEYFSKAIQIYPNDPQAYDLKGVAYFRLFKIEDAINELKKAIECDPSFHLAYFHLAEVFLLQRDFTIAEGYCNQAINIESANELYLCTKASIKLELKENLECIRLCNQILNANPVNTLALEYRANAYMNQRDFKRAIADFEVLYGNTIENSTVLNNLGYLYSNIGEVKLAKKFLLAAIKFDPGFSYPYNNLGYVHLQEGDLKRAHEYIDKSIELDPTNSYAYKNKALVYIKENDFSGALAALEKAKVLRFDLYFGNEVDNLLKELKGNAL